ncbi:MAG: histidine kinase [Crocinitomicaceae bacterium]
MRGFLFVLFLLLQGHFLFAQQYSFDSYSTNSGLSQSQVYDIVQDEQGFLWIATEGGLNRFDGREFKIFTAEDGLIRDAIRSLLIVKNELYIGSKGGVSVYSNKTFKQIPFAEEHEKFRVDCIQFFNDTLFVGTNGASIFYMDNKQLLPYPFFPKDQKIRDLFADEGHFLVTTKEGLYVKTKESGFLLRNKDISFGRIKKENDHIYIGSYKPTGVYSFQDNKLNKLDFLKEVETIRDFQINGENLYVITKSDMVCYNLVSQTKEYEVSSENGMPNAQLLRLFKDREANLWIATDGKGFTRFVGETFVSYSTKEGIGSNQIMYITKKDSVFYLGSYNNGLTIWKNKNEHKILNESNGLPSNTVWTMCVEDEYNFLIGTQQGLSIVSQGKMKNYFEKDGLYSDKITAIAKIDQNQYLIGGPNGVNFYDGKEFKKEFFGQHLNVWVRDIKIGLNGNIWFATLNGVYLYDGTHLIQIGDNQFFNEVNAIDIIDDDLVVIGTERGIYFVQNKKILKPDVKLSKTSKEVNMVKYFDGNLCFGTNSGFYIAQLDKPTLEVSELKRFSAIDGLPGSEVNLNAVYVENKEIWFGMEEALVKFRYDKIHDLDDYIEPTISIADLKIFLENKDLSDFSTSIGTDGLPIDLKLPFKYNYVTIEFSGLSFKNNNELKYQYKLEGFGEEWTPYLENDFATFTSLSPGKYTFKVRAINKSGLISETASFSFEILPPFWLTWWFISSSILGLIGIVVFIVNYRTKIIKQKKDNENLIYKSKLLQLEQQSLNASMNRHFIFNSLNSIQYFINVSDKISANKYLTNFAKLIRKNLDSTTNENNMVVLSDEISRLELYLSLESMRFSGKFEYKIEIDPSVDIDIIEVPSMMLQPFVENSIIHGILPKKEKGEISIKIFVKDEFIVFEILDNGIGIIESQKSKKNYDSEHDSKGMEITANRVDILKRILRKDLKIVGPNEIYEKDGAISGTLVQIYLKID